MSAPEWPRRVLASFTAVVATLVITSGAGLPQAAPPRTVASDAVDERAVIRRDRFGVPHILAETEEAAAFAHGYVTAEDHGPELAKLFLRARGTIASVFGPGFAEMDLVIRSLGIREVAAERFTDLPPYMQGILRGYAAGYNAYLRRHRAEFPNWATPVTAVDVLAHSRAVLLIDFAVNFGQWIDSPRQSGASNVWAIGRPLSKSGRGMLLANPHLAWDGSNLFHEVQLTVPGIINVSGATLIGLPVITIGFNEALGWSHTVNYLDSDDLYELTLDPTQTKYEYDGRWLPLEARTVSIQIRTAKGLKTRTERLLSSHYGPVRIRNGRAYALKSANLELVNFLTQWNNMGKATTLRAFTAAVNMQQLPMFNLGYADREGNIWYLYNGRIPLRPSGYDWAGIVPGNTSRTEWFAIRPVDELPHLRNPKSGYIQNCNNVPWYTNIEERIDPARFADLITNDGLNWRSQMSLQILSREHELTVERLMQYKFNSEFPFAQRIKAELVPLAKAAGSDELRDAADVLEAWDNHTDVNSRGAVLFVAWQDEYGKVAPQRFNTPWSAADPIQTPKGLANPAGAVEALARAAATVKKRHGALDVPWGETHRLRRGDLDLPIGGMPLALQNVKFSRDADGKFFVVAGDTYVLAVEFTAGAPRAFTIVPYSQSSNPKSPHFDDQAPLYATEQFKPAWFTEPDIAANLSRQYRPNQ